jgi:hypothetical protein
VREREILGAALRLSHVTLLMLDGGLADVAATEPQTVQGIARKESLRLLRQLIEQTTHATGWALQETADLERPLAREPHIAH